MKHNIRDSKGRFTKACKEPEKVYMRGYKGFEKGLICKDKQYKVGEVFEEPEAVMCVRGLHFCKSPTDVLRYYSPSASEYCEVEALAPVIEGEDKCVTTKLRIVKKLSLQELANELLQGHEGTKTVLTAYLADKVGARIVSEHPRSLVANSGCASIIRSTGGSATISNNGDGSLICATGPSACISNKGRSSAIFTAYSYSSVSNTGDNVRIVSSGDEETVSNVGVGSALSVSGRRSIASSTGYASSVETSNPTSVVVNTGLDGRVRGVLGSVLVLYTARTGPIAVKVDGKKIKPYVWYTANKYGEIVEAEKQKGKEE